MAQAVSYEVTDGIAVLQMRNPPVNALGAALRRDLAEALARAVQDREVGAIVLSGAGKGFCAGADIAEFEAPFADPWVPELCDLVENAPKPVIAAILRFHSLTFPFASIPKIGAFAVSMSSVRSLATRCSSALPAFSSVIS